MNNIYKLVTLKNNLRVLIFPKSDAHSISLNCVIKTGAMDDPIGESGLAHMVEHFIMHRSNKLDASGLAQLQEILGGAFSGSIDDSIIRIGGQFHYSKVAETLDLLKDIVFDRNFENISFDEVKRVVTEEISLDEDDPFSLVAKFARSVRFSTLTSLSFLSCGTIKTVNSIKFRDITDFYKAYFVPENCFLVLTGKIQTEKTENLIQRIFGSIKNSNFKTNKKPVVSYSDKIIKKITKPYSNIYTLVNFPGLSRKDSDLERAAAAFTNYILISSQSSRLYNILKNQIYDFSGETIFEKIYGIFGISWSSNPRKHKTILKAIFEEIEKIKNEQVSNDEIVRARNYCNQFDEMDFDNVNEIADWFIGELVFEGKIMLPQDLKKLRDKVTPAVIQKVAKRIFNLKKINLVVIGPVAKLAPGWERLLI